MLAKQGWRILHNPDSLCGQILRAKYFPNGNILQAKPVRGMSYTWGSILKGIKLVKKGMICRIGNENSVHIWNGPWTPRGITRQPTSHRGQNLIQWVNELIDPSTGQWDVAMVQQTFHPDDVQTILAIPVGGDFDDYIAWHFDKKGVFTVKSAYKVQIDKASSRQGTGQGVSVQNLVMGNSFPWNKIWSMKCPNKVKVFAWRLAHNSMPLKREIQSRGMDIDTCCPVCWRMDEDAGHMLLKCKNSRLFGVSYNWKLKGSIWLLYNLLKRYSIISGEE
jgi:hypothetical protein